MNRLIFLLLALLQAMAAASAAASPNRIVPELVAEGPVAPGGEVELAIVMHTAPGWHGYWSNPGDAGLGPTFAWSVPKGAALGPLRFPVPSRLTVAGLVNYVYKRDHALLLRLTAPADARGALRLVAKGRWLACTDEVCVPEQGEIALTVPVADGPPTERARFDQWRRALPRPLSAPARFARSGDRIDLAIALPAGVALGEPYVFAHDPGAVLHGAPQRFRRVGDTLVAELAAGRGGQIDKGGVLALGDGRGLELTAVPGPVPAGGTPVGDLGGRALLLAALGALAGGLLLNLMPCVFPILALKALHLARAGSAAARGQALGYAAGAVIGTGLLGALLLAVRAGGSAAGWAFQLQDPRTTVLLLLLAAAITLNLLRTFELPSFGGEANRFGSVGTGALAAFVATPCSGPFLGAALGTALLLPAWGSVVVFAMLGLGLALPFVVLAFIPALQRRLPRPGPWMVRLQRFLAVPMAATAVGCLWLLWRQGGAAALAVGLVAVAALALLLVWAGWRQRRGEPNGIVALAGAAALVVAAALLIPQRDPTAARVPLGQQAWSEAAVARNLAERRPMLVYFTADWCLTCKVNEAGAIDRQAVRAAFGKAGVKVLVGDWTNGDPAISRFLERRGRAGVPLYLWYAPGRPEPEELPQVLTPAMLIARAESLSPAPAPAPAR